MKSRTHAGGRASKHPWEEIEKLYIQGEDRKKLGNGRKPELTREWPNQTDLAARYGLHREQISRRFARIGAEGKTAHQRREIFQAEYKRQINDNILKALVGREIQFRVAAMDLAETSLRQIAIQLSGPQTGDSLSKLLTAAKRAQEVGMVALDRPANGPEDSAGQGAEDWSLMREVRRGARTVSVMSASGD